MPRLFTGLEIPSEIALALSLKRGGMPGSRWIDPENYHITLSFIGDVETRMAREIAYYLGDVRGFEPIPICLEHLDAFGGDRPRSIFARVQPNEELNILKGTLDAALGRAGVKSEKRKYVPHVTLARLRGASSLMVADYLEGNSTVAPLRFTARRFVLFSSKPSMGGGPYALEQTYDLDDYASGAEEFGGDQSEELAEWGWR